MARKINMFVIADAVTPTGFSRVMHSILENLPKDKYNISWLGINYHGDPHPYHEYKIYPAHVYNSDPHGLSRIAQIFPKDIDIIFILSDAWVVADYLKHLKKLLGVRIPKVVVYTPVDAEDHDKKWYSEYDVVNKLVAYTEFGRKVISESYPEANLAVIPHGVNTKDFYPITMDKKTIKKLVYPNSSEYIDSFVVLNANRNQPRKMIDISLRGFAEFAKDKPSNVKFYFHGGVIDAGWDIQKLAVDLGIQKRLIITSLLVGPQRVSDIRLNQIYNASDVGLNTSVGEGWGLTNTEHAATGAVQLVPDHSACTELFGEFGYLIESPMKTSLPNINTLGRIPDEADVTEKLNRLYNLSAEEFTELGLKMQEKFTRPEYQWCTIGEQWDNLFDEVLDDN